MQQFRIRAWKAGGLVIQERHTTAKTPLHKDVESGKVTNWKNLCWPTKGGLMSSMTDLLMEDDEDFGNANNKEELLVAYRRYEDRKVELTEKIIQEMNENGWVTK